MIADETESDMNAEDHVVVGNDSFEYNKNIVNGGSYYSGGIMAENPSDGKSEASNWNISEILEYKSKFNSGEFLTSTLLDELEVERASELNDVKKIRSIISKIELKVSSFVVDINKDIKLLKEVAEENKRKPALAFDDISAIESVSDDFLNSGIYVVRPKQ